MKTFVMSFVLLLSINTMAAVNCYIISADHPELTTGVKAEQICSDATTALFAKYNYDIARSGLTLTVTAQNMFTVEMFYQLVGFGGLIAEGAAIEYLYPVDSAFVLVEELETK